MPDYFNEIKRYLYIDFIDDDTDRRLSGECRRAEARLNRLIGYEGQYSIDMADQDLLQLLFDFVRYIHNGAADEFERDYEEDIAMKRYNHQVYSDVETESETESI